MSDFKSRLDAVEDEYIKFNRVESPLSNRPDLCAFLLIEKLAPGKSRDIVTAAEHDVIYLDVDVDALNKAASDDDILTLCRCGVMYDEETDSLAMFV